MTEARTADALIARALRGHTAGLFAITGPAGAGKSSAASAVCSARGAALYSIDYRFIGGSAERRFLLERKQERSADDYRDSANQYNWWDWPEIERDLAELVAGRRVVLDRPYDRESGTSGAPIEISPRSHILLDGAILGPPQLVAQLTTVFFLNTRPEVRFERILTKDGSRRSFNEILARFLITEYSETLYYRNLVAWAQGKIVSIDTATGMPGPEPSLVHDLFIPIRIKR